MQCVRTPRNHGVTFYPRIFCSDAATCVRHHSALRLVRICRGTGRSAIRLRWMKTRPRRSSRKMPAAVLVVEDEVLVRMYVSDVLGQSGFDVVEADNAEEALSRHRNRHRHLRCGQRHRHARVVRRFRASAHDCAANFPRVGVVLVSGVLEPKDIYMPLGVRFVAKPVRAATLLRLVREVADPRAQLPKASIEQRI